MKRKIKIFGAGPAGLIAACYNPKAEVFEKSESPVQNHKALLRFRSDEVSRITGIKFKKITVCKAIWSTGGEKQPSPRLIAGYAKKVSGGYSNRSISNIDSAVRWIAPDNFYYDMVEDIGDRINFGYNISSEDYKFDGDIISTLPLAVNAKMLGIDCVKTISNIKTIYVNTYLIENCDMYSTIYYPDKDIPVYRASITGNKLIVESVEKLNKYNDLDIVLFSMGIVNGDITQVDVNHAQKMGKLSTVSDDERRMLLYKMSHNHGVYSLGRFALHRQILLDDVAHDVTVIKNMMLDDTYGVSIKERG